MINVAFAGLRHGHIFALYNEALRNPSYTVLGAFEENEDARREAESRGLICNYESLDALLADERVDVVALGGCYGERGGARRYARLVGRRPVRRTGRKIVADSREAR